MKDNRNPDTGWFPRHLDNFIKNKEKAVLEEIGDGRVDVFLYKKTGTKYVFNKYKIQNLKWLLGADRLQRMTGLQQMTIDSGLLKWRPVQQKTYDAISRFLNGLIEEEFEELWNAIISPPDDPRFGLKFEEKIKKRKESE